MIYVLSFIILVAVIGIVTNRLNAKTPCEHNWIEHEHGYKCSKCAKAIRKHAEVYRNAA